MLDMHFVRPLLEGIDLSFTPHIGRSVVRNVRHKVVFIGQQVGEALAEKVHGGIE
jgi:hypothetical protein